MRYFTDKIKFNKEMKSLEKILKTKGFVLESDHVYAYAMQYGDAFEDVKGWLLDNGYEGELETMGAFEGVAVYGLYDSAQITFIEMQKELLDQAKSQI